MARFTATVEPTVQRHEHHVWHGPAGEPALPAADELVDIHWTVPEGRYPLAEGVAFGDMMVGPHRWTMPDGTEVFYFPGYFGPGKGETPLHRVETQAVELTGFLWRVEDDETDVVEVGFTASEQEAGNQARAWVAATLAGDAARPAPVVPTAIDLEAILAAHAEVQSQTKD